MERLKVVEGFWFDNMYKLYVPLGMKVVAYRDPETHLTKVKFIKDETQKTILSNKITAHNKTIKPEAISNQ